jgi:hypothetical protein
MGNRSNAVPIADAAPQPEPTLRPVILIIVASVLVGAGLVVWMIQTAHNASDHQFARRRLLLVSMALLNYSDGRGHLPYQVVRQEPAVPSKEADPPDGAGGPPCAEHVRQLGGASPLHNLMEVKC